MSDDSVDVRVWLRFACALEKYALASPGVEQAVLLDSEWWDLFVKHGDDLDPSKEVIEHSYRAQEIRKLFSGCVQDDEKKAQEVLLRATQKRLADALVEWTEKLLKG